MEGAALENLGATYKELKDFTQAISYYQQALVLAQELKSRQKEAEFQQNLAAAYNSLENRRLRSWANLNRSDFPPLQATR